MALEREWLDRELGLLSRMDRPAGMAELARIGAVAAERLPTPAHLPASFDPRES